MVKQMQVLAALVAFSEIALALGLFWAIEAHLV